MTRYRAIRGMQDVFPEEAGRFRALESIVRSAAERYGYGEIRTPLVEPTELFIRSIGESTDIVEKEMFSFTGSGEKRLSLRPEGTAGVVRACLEHDVFNRQSLARYYYLGSMFRRERPQAGRRRQFHQFGIEALGSLHPAVDAEVIDLLICCLEETGLEGWTLGINSVGCSRCRPAYREKLYRYLSGRRAELCDHCRRRLEDNPLRALDCKNPGCRTIVGEGPKPAELFCEECESHYEAVRGLLVDLAVPFAVNPLLVRGLDYYTSVVFEAYGPGLGAQDAVAGGGRYDTLIEDLGGPSLGAAGFSIGLERLLLGVGDRVLTIPAPSPGHLYIVTASPEAFRPNFILLSRLRRRGFRAGMDYLDRSLKAQMREANKLGANHVLIRGEEEIERGVVKLKDMKSGEEAMVREDEVANIMTKSE
ncbi:MAG: histidine--tRNA ligase [PVC group bacterium]